MHLLQIAVGPGNHLPGAQRVLACAVKFLNAVECPSSQGVLYPERELPGITAAHVVTDEIKKGDQQ